MRCLRTNCSAGALKRAVLTLAVMLALTPVALAQDFDIDWYTIDGGGEMWTAGGDFELSGTIGQPDASTTIMTGGDFELVGGFWAGAAGDGFCFGDIEPPGGDGDVDLADLAELLGAYGECEGDPFYNADADFNDSGCVDLSDLAALLGVYGTTCP